jgi:hypothetical protein
MSVNGLEGARKEVVRPILKYHSIHFYGGTRGNHERPVTTVNLSQESNLGPHEYEEAMLTAQY